MTPTITSEIGAFACRRRAVALRPGQRVELVGWLEHIDGTRRAVVVDPQAHPVDAEWLVLNPGDEEAVGALPDAGGGVGLEDATWPKLIRAIAAVHRWERDVLGRCTALRERVALARLSGEAVIPLNEVQEVLTGAHEVIDHCRRAMEVTRVLNAELKALEREAPALFDSHHTEGPS